MVNLSPDHGDFSPNSQSPVPTPTSTTPALSRYEIVVPVFLKVSLTSEDELAAEVHAIEAVRSMGIFSNPDAHGGLTVKVHSIISPQAM